MKVTRLQKKKREREIKIVQLYKSHLAGKKEEIK